MSIFITALFLIVSTYVGVIFLYFFLFAHGFSNRKKKPMRGAKDENRKIKESQITHYVHIRC